MLKSPTSSGTLREIQCNLVKFTGPQFSKALSMSYNYVMKRDFLEGVMSGNIA